MQHLQQLQQTERVEVAQAAILTLALAARTHQRHCLRTPVWHTKLNLARKEDYHLHVLSLCRAYSCARCGSVARHYREELDVVRRAWRHEGGELRSKLASVLLAFLTH